jgi:hypothetical protein
MFAMLSGPWPRVTFGGLALAALEADVAAGTATRDALAAAVDTVVAEAVAAQVEAGIGLVTDGDVRWPDAQAAALAAIAASDTGPDGRLVRAWRATAALTELPCAQSVPGPWSLAVRDVGGWGDPGVVTGRAAELADALAADLAALEAAGCPVVVVREPAAVTIDDDPALRAGFIRAHRRLLAGTTSLHAMLAIPGGSAHAAGPETIFGAPYASHLFDLIAGPDNWYLVRAAPADRGIVCAALVAGVPGDKRDQAPLLAWAAGYAASANARGLDRVGLANASPLGGLTPADASAALEALGRAATLAALPPAEAVDAGMDPRSIFAKRGRTRT